MVPTDIDDGLPVPSPTIKSPLADNTTVVTASVPLPINTPFAGKVFTPKPPLATGNIPEVPTDITELFADKPEPANKVARASMVVNCSVEPSESSVSNLSPFAGVTSLYSLKSIALEV